MMKRQRDLVRKGGRRGFTLPIAIAVIAVVGISALAIYQATSTSQLYVLRESAATAAYFLAEAGAERAMARLRDDPSVAVPLTSEALGGGEFTYAIRQISTDGDVRTVQIDARGTQRESRADLVITERLLLTLKVSGLPPAVRIEVTDYRRAPVPGR